MGVLGQDLLELSLDVEDKHLNGSLVPCLPIDLYQPYLLTVYRRLVEGLVY